MTREILLVQVIYKDGNAQKKGKAFTSSKKAEEYFKRIMVEDYGVEDTEEIECALDDGFYEEIMGDEILFIRDVVLDEE